MATAVLTGVGWSQADRLFPLAGADWVPWLAGASAGATILAATYVLVSLYAAQTRILIGTEEELERYKIQFRWSMRALWGRGETALVHAALADQARMQEAPTLTDVDRRAQRLDRIATRLELGTDQGLARAARRESDRLNAYVGLAELRVVLMLLEHRARRVSSLVSLTSLGLLVAALGIAGVFTAANDSQGARNKANVALTCLDQIKKADPKAQPDLEKACVKLVAP